LFFSQRLIEPEVLDHLPPEEARPNLADLVRINRYFGGHSTVRHTLEQAANGEQCFSLLDIGCGSGDSARILLNEYPRARVTCLDHNVINMERAPYPKLIADAFELPFRPESFDFVFSSLFLHHFTDEQVVGLLGQFYRIARKAVLVCDLDRNLLPYIFLRMEPRNRA
jgi:ubiquinone/menaquinone biosynthesis C-methylase UbiE